MEGREEMIYDPETGPETREEFRPRMIIWQLMPDEGAAATNGKLTPQEAMLVIDGIARVAKSILVLTGRDLAAREDLYDLVAYGHALGLKMILELTPEELTPELLVKFREFGPRLYRIVVDGRIAEDPSTRYKQTPEFERLDAAVARLREAGCEVHCAVNIQAPDERSLDFVLDYAYRRGSTGLYCHLQFDPSVPESVTTDDETRTLDGFIVRIGELKPLVPSNMYCSPQCVKYIPNGSDKKGDESGGFRGWSHVCLAGKTFAFIDEHGKVLLCSGMREECGDLRANGFDFGKIWAESPRYLALRREGRTCVETRLAVKGNGRRRAHTGNDR